MGRRGPQPTPTAILENRGSWLAVHRKDAGEDRLADMPAPPQWLADKYREHWERFGGYLVGNGVMKERFVESVAALCVAYQDFIDYATGANPDLDADKVYKRLMDALTRHGLTPASAGAVAVTTKAKPTGLAALKLASA